jgi:hypothetical protein
VRFVGRGHAAIRATHTKTIELTTDADITERATCVIAVGVEGPPHALAGPVRVTIGAGRRSYAFLARANSSWEPGGPAVIRRSPLQLPGTFATRAEAVAGDLPRMLAEALRDPRAVVTVDVEPVPGPPCAVLFALDPGGRTDPRLAAELAAADLVVAEDAEAARRCGERVAHGPVAVEGRVLVLAVTDLPGATVAAALRAVEIETVGLPPALAAAAASPARGPVLLVPPGADARDLLRRAPAGTRLVVALPADRVPALLELAHDLRGVDSAVLVHASTPPRRVTADDHPAGHDLVHVCLGAAEGGTALDPAVRTAIDGLLADGVATKTAARALAALTGWERRRAYDAVLAWGPLT